MIEKVSQEFDGEEKENPVKETHEEQKAASLEHPIPVEEKPKIEEKEPVQETQPYDFFEEYAKHPLYKEEELKMDPLPEYVEGQCPQWTNTNQSMLSEILPAVWDEKGLKSKDPFDC